MIESPDISRSAFAGRYRTRRVLRQRHHGATILAHDLQTSETVVLRSARGRLSPSRQSEIQETVARIHALRPRCVGAATTAGHADDVVYVESPYVPGTSLAARLADGRLTVPESLSITAGILADLVQAHAGGVLHAHLRPGNVILPPAGSMSAALLVDYFESPTSPLAATFGVIDVDLVRYLSPEQAGLINRQIDERSDLYSVGALLYHCLAGRPLFEAATLRDILRNHLLMPPPRLAVAGGHIPAVVDEIAQRLLRKDPDDRYQSAAAALRDVTAAIDSLQSSGNHPAIVIGAADRRRTITEPAFIGRAAELARLTDALEDAAHGGGGLVLVSGESGAGKSRLLAEFRHRAEGAQTWMLDGQGVDRAASQPLQLLANVGTEVALAAEGNPALAERLRALLTDHRAALTTILPDLAPLWPEPALPAPTPISTPPLRAAEAVISLIDTLGTPDRPAVIILDDCQWADELSLEVLVRWARQSAGPRSAPCHVLVVAAVVEEWCGRDHPLRSIEPAHRLRLSAFAPTEGRNLVASMAGAISDDGVDAVLALAEGNPFMITAVLRGMVEAGAIVSGSGGWEYRPGIAAAQASSQAAELLSQRVRLLDEPTRVLLSWGAILGPAFDPAVARALAEQSNDVAERALAQAIERHLIWRESASQVAFVHTRLRAAFLDLVPDDDAPRWHARAAEVIEDRDPTQSFDLAYHYDAAGQPTRALDHALRSGATALRRYDLELAERQYRIAERGIRFADHPGDRRVVAEALGSIHLLRGRYQAATERLRYARTLEGDILGTARIDAQLGELAYKQGDVDQASALLQNALTALGERIPTSPVGFIVALLWELTRRGWALASRPVRRRRRDAQRAPAAHLAAQLRNRLFYTWMSGNRGNRESAWLLLRQLNELGPAPHDREFAHAYAVAGAAISVVWPPLWKRALRFTDKAKKIHERLSDPWGVGQALHMRGFVLHAGGQFIDAADSCQRAVEILERAGDSWERNTAAWIRALCLYRAGQLPEAQGCARRTHEQAVAAGDALTEALSLLTWAKATNGIVPADLIDSAAGWSGSDLEGTVALLQAHALQLRARGELDGAVTALEKAERQLRDSRVMDVYFVSVLPWLATLYREQAEQTSPFAPHARRTLIRRARRAARRAARHAFIYRNERPHALRELGMVAALAGRRRRARRLLDRSARIAQEQQALTEYRQTVRSRRRLDDPARPAGSERTTETADPGMTDSLGLADRFTTLRQTGRDLTTAASSQDILDAVSRASRVLLRAETCEIVLSDADRVGPQPPAEISDLIETAVRERRAAVLARPLLSPAAGAGPRSAGSIRSALCVPILGAGEVAGWFLITHGQVSGLFGEQEEQLAEFVGHLAGAALERERLEHASRSGAIAAQESERARISRDLHDEIGQAITSVMLGLRSVETSLVQPAGHDEALRRLHGVRDIAADTVSRVQRLAHELRPTVLDDDGLIPALQRLVREAGSRYGINAQFAVPPMADAERLAPDVETTVYRIVQEALTNVGRHANATTCSVVLVRTTRHLRIIIEDDGRGIVESEAREGSLGLTGMRERAELVHATLQLQGEPGAGTTVILEVPVA